jgi:hypothetical protein
MDREAYNACLRPYISGSMPQDQRKLQFCIGAKVCSGKAKTEEEARQICMQPKPAKTSKRTKKGASCEKEMATLAACVSDNIDRSMPPDLLKDQIKTALIKCQCS